VAIEILVPRLGWSMEEGTFAGWLKKDGESIKPGDALFVLESDKSSEEIEALDAGILRISAEAPKPGDTVKVGQVLAHLVSEGEPTPSIVSFIKQPPPIAVSSIPTQNSELRTQNSAKPISPRARRVARELGVDFTRLTGSGRNGRIRERDVRAATTSQLAERVIPHTSIRRTIAARMIAGVTQAAPVTLTTKCDATNLVALRNQFKSAPANDLVPSYTDLIAKLTAGALRQHPLLQAQWRDEGLFVPQRIDIALAVDTEAGLLVPVVRNVDHLPLRQLAARSRELIEQARAGRLSSDDMRDATFTISNLGSFGIDAFTPIIHLPQCAVLGIGRIVRELAVRDEQIVPRDMLTLSLTFDHRIVDGAMAARFLQMLCASLENPAPLLIS
jgi:pyruvate dehydrogenase E2 component (dihydrolipoamide acetyltransferase)